MGHLYWLITQQMPWYNWKFVEYGIYHAFFIIADNAAYPTFLPT